MCQPPLSLSVVCPLDDPAWDLKVSSLPRSSFFHRAAWARVLTETYGFRAVYFTINEAERLAGVLPCMDVQSWLTGHRGVSLPFTDSCEPLYREQNAIKHLLSGALAYGTEHHWKHVELRGISPAVHDDAASTVYYQHCLALVPDENAQFQRLEASVQRACRKAERSGVKIEFSRNLEDVHAFYSLLEKTRRRHGVPPQPFGFFENIHRQIVALGHGTVILAKLDRVAIAGAMFFHADDTVIFKFGASDLRFQQYRANNLVMWHAIKRFASEGFRSLDFGRTSQHNPGLRKFKSGWGAAENTLQYFRYSIPSGKTVIAPDQSVGWHQYFFRFAPTFFTRAVGAALYRHVA